MDWTLHQGWAQDILPGDYAGRVNLVVTSPPYDGLRNYDGHASDFDFDAIADALVPCLAPGGVIVWVVADAIVDGSETGTSARQQLGFMARGLRLHQTLIYQRWSINGQAANRYYREHEYMFVFSNGQPGSANMLTDRATSTPGQVRPNVGAGRQSDGTTSQRLGLKPPVPKTCRRGSVWRYAAGSNQRDFRPGGEVVNVHEHPAVFPYALAADHIRTWSNPGDLVLDPMAGSGTVLRAAVDLGRTAIGVEVNPAYCDLIRRRMAQAVLIAPEDA